MFDTIVGFGSQLFITIVLILAAGISSSICHGLGTHKGRETFICLILLLMAGVQMFHLINAVIYVPATRFYTFNARLYREDCIDSSKGGKRPGKSRHSIYENPYCEYGNNCTIVATGLPSNTTNGTTCPRGRSAVCHDKKGAEVDKYVPKLRNCMGGQGSQCTEEQPCSPCELTKLVEFGEGRCGSCSTEFTGACNFIPGVGPYCLESTTSKKVVPCKTCCTPPEPLIVDGICY
jgi:hypothetical protein